jgi:hypothetical protein
MGRSLAMAEFVGTRVAGTLSWVPAHIKANGEKVMSRVEIPVYANTGKGKNPKTGEKGRSDSYKFIVWGPMADTCCKSLPTGRGLSIFGRPDPYMGKLYNDQGIVRTDSAGMEIMVPKMAFVVFDLKFEDDSAKQIAQEIQTGRRPMHWNVENHPDWALWVKILNDRQASVWDGRSPKFEYARVVMPQGAGVTIDFAALQPKRQRQQNQSLPEMVAATFGANLPAGAKFDHMTGQPIQAPAPLFDPMTGQPIGRPQPIGYDPQTGVPIYGSRNEMLTAAFAGFPTAPQTPVIPAVGTALF